MTLYPVFLKIEHHKVLIVGGGEIAEQKLEGVLRSATDVTVIAPQVNHRIASWATEGRIRHIAHEYESGMANGYFLVIAATDSAKVNHQVYEEAKQAGALCNAVDDPPYCDFYASALVSRGDFQIAISTAGHSPALAQRVRKKLELEYGPEYENWIAWLGRMRTTLRAVLPRSERRRELLHLLAMLRPAGSEYHQMPQETNMDHSQRIELEAQIRQTLKDHQHEGLHMIGGVDQLVSRLLDTVEAWIQSDSKTSKKTA